MSGRKIFLDSNIIIFASKNLFDLSRLLLDYDEFYVSMITYMEVYGFKFKNKVEKSIIDAIFEDIEVIDINMAVAQKVIQYRQLEHKKIKIPDAIILATAKVIEADLLTDDWDDFQTIDDTVSVVKTDYYR